MGYQTKFELTFEAENETEINDYMEDNSEKFYGLGEDSYKWYDHEESMKELSVKFPDIVFALYGEGEDNEDIWYKYFKNGKMQECMAIITFNEYDESKLI